MPNTVNSGLPFDFVSQRDFTINGASMVKVMGGAHMSGGLIYYLTELGLPEGPIHVAPRLVHKDIYVDAYGRDSGVPADVMWIIADVTISMTLSHYNFKALDVCIQESMGGRTLSPKGSIDRTAAGFDSMAGLAGQYLNPTGRMMGGGIPHLQSGYHFISLNILSPLLQFGWRFPAAYLAQPPVRIPLGTRASLVDLTWRAIPYWGGSTAATYNTTITYNLSGATNPLARPFQASGATLWDHNLDQQISGFTG